MPVTQISLASHLLRVPALTSAESIYQGSYDQEPVSAWQILMESDCEDEIHVGREEPECSEAERFRASISIGVLFNPPHVNICKETGIEEYVQNPTMRWSGSSVYQGSRS